MRRRKFLLGSAALFGGSGLVTATSGFSTMESQRGMYVDVVGDGDALLQLKYPPQTIDCNGEIQLVEIRNLTGTELTSVTVSVESAPDAVSLSANSDITVVNDEPMGKGEHETVMVTATAERGFTGEGEITFNVSANGEGVSIETTQARAVAIDVDCPEREIREVEFQQKGNRVGFGSSLNETVSVWFVDDNIKSESVVLRNKDQITKGALTANGDFDIIAAKIGNSSTVFISPYWTGEKLDSGSGGSCQLDNIDDVSSFLADKNNFPVCE